MSDSQIHFKEPIQVVVQNSNKEEKPFSSLPLWLDLVKWLIGTVALGLLGWYTNYKIQETQLKSEQLNKEREIALRQIELDATLIEAVSEKYSESTKSQLSYLRYIQPFITTDCLQVAVQRQIRVLRNELNSNVSAKLNQQISQEIAKALPNQRDLWKRIAAEEKTTSNVSAQLMPSLDQSTFDDSFDTSFVYNAITSIEKSKSLSTPNIQYDYILIGAPETQWCKVGYYIVFNSVLRIGVNKLSKDAAVVNFKLVKSSDFNSIEKNIKDDVTLIAGGFIEVNEGDFRYEISLDYIGAGGKNPFTRAAYITVATYSKTKSN